MNVLTAHAVIGAQYGDEGKGLMTDSLAAALGGEAIVVRSNGGSQAAHTVLTPKGVRHVFSHFGSGSFAGARTHLSRHMISNPIFFNGEKTTLEGHGLKPVVTVDPASMVTIPMDALINQGVETLRSQGRHGSCGHGIGETVERNEHPDGFPIRVSDLAGLTAGYLREIRELWLGRRVQALGYESLPQEFMDLLHNEDISRTFLDDCHRFIDSVDLVDDSKIAEFDLPIIFEAAQGLALDQTMGAFPYVTRSNTGLLNIVELSKLAGIRHLSVNYMTRCYTTRHGAGPLYGESQIRDYITVYDPTNIHNNWQGSLRFAPLNLDFLRDNIRKDRASVNGIAIDETLVITCLDQIRKDELPIFVEDKLKIVTLDEFFMLLNQYGFLNVAESRGASRLTLTNRKANNG